MKIEVNNVYQKKSISKLKVGIVIAVFIAILALIVWRLYYERVETTGVTSFAEFMGVAGIVNDIGDIFKRDDIVDSDFSSINEEEITIDNEANEPQIYIPNFTEQSLNNIKSIYNLPEDGQKRVYLTFDDGPSKDVTPLILDILKEEGVYATFFVLGSKAEQNGEVLKRAYEEGHYIANHGYSHVYSKVYTNSDTTVDEYNQCEDAIRQAIGVPEYSSHLFRFPGGSVGGSYHSVKKECIKKFEENGVAYLDWNSLTRDSEGNFPVEKLVQNFKDTSYNKNNLVILMHDAPGKILVPEALKEVIASLKEWGYEFGDMRELIES